MYGYVFFSGGNYSSLSSAGVYKVFVAVWVYLFRVGRTSLLAYWFGLLFLNGDNYFLDLHWWSDSSFLIFPGNLP